MAFQEFGDEFADGDPDGGDEEAETDGVGEESRGEEEGASDEDDEAFDDRGVGKLAGGGGFLELAEHADALGFCECSSQNASEENNGEGGNEADLRANGVEDGKLGDGYEDEECEKAGEHGGGGA